MKRPKKKGASLQTPRPTAIGGIRDSRQFGEVQAVKRSWRQFLRIHPALEAIPPLGATELQALAQSIRQHGLLEPIHVATVDGVTYLLDGRGRLDAMELLGWQIVLNEKGECSGRMAARRHQRKAVQP
jgi:hypothetical protein